MDPQTFDPETYQILGAAMEVHRAWGPGFLEAVYHKSLVLELELRGVPVRSEVPYPLQYKGFDLGTCYRADLVCGTVLVELKAHAGLTDADLAQTLHYMRSSGLGRGLVVNFGLPSLQYRRLVLGSAWAESVKSVQSVAGGAATADPPATSRARPTAS